MRLAIIPARGGSKRIPNKNIKKFFGKPIIGYSIEEAQITGLFDEIIVSTDSDEISNVAKHFGAITPFIRPNVLADDYASTGSVIAHAVDWMNKNRWDVEALCCIYPTAPLMAASDIASGYNEFATDRWDYVFSAMKINSPERTFSLNSQSGIEMFFPEHYVKRSQVLSPAYSDAGQFYWGRPQAWLESKIIYSNNSTVVLVPPNRVTDINTNQDWENAESLFEKFNKAH